MGAGVGAGGPGRQGGNSGAGERRRQGNPEKYGVIMLHGGGAAACENSEENNRPKRGENGKQEKGRKRTDRRQWKIWWTGYRRSWEEGWEMG